jgi:hypothetical protein
MMTSGHDFLLQVTEKYRDLPCLWQVTHSDYHDKIKRNVAIDKLLVAFKTKDVNVNRETVLKKINSLRSCLKRNITR